MNISEKASGKYQGVEYVAQIIVELLILLIE